MLISTYINFYPFQPMCVLRWPQSRHVPVELLIIAVPLNRVQPTTLQVIVAGKGH